MVNFIYFSYIFILTYIPTINQQVPLLRLASKVFPAAAIIPNKVETEGFKNPNDCVRCKQSPLSSPVDSIRLATADACMSGILHLFFKNI